MLETLPIVRGWNTGIQSRQVTSPSQGTQNIYFYKNQLALYVWTEGKPECPQKRMIMQTPYRFGDGIEPFNILRSGDSANHKYQI